MLLDSGPGGHQSILPIVMHTLTHADTDAEIQGDDCVNPDATGDGEENTEADQTVDHH